MSDKLAYELKPKFPKVFQHAFAQFPNITSDREIMSGTPCVRGRRIPVWVIAGRFAGGDTIPYIAKDYGLTPKDVRDAIRFACWTSQIGKIKFWKFWRTR